MSRPRRLELKVSSEQAGTRLDQFLAAPLGSRAHAQSLIDAQRVRVDGRPRPKRHLVRTGELVEVEEATQLGHRSTETLFRHYRELVTREEAAEFWSIAPTQPASPNAPRVENQNPAPVPLTDSRPQP